MTARYCSCSVDLEGMRLARAEDAKLCARLTARVKELEKEVARLSAADQPFAPVVLAVASVRPRWSYGDDCDHKRQSCEDIGCHGQIFRAYDAAKAAMAKAGLAEGTRDETAARCHKCGVPAPTPSILRPWPPRCEACWP